MLLIWAVTRFLCYTGYLNYIKDCINHVLLLLLVRVTTTLFTTTLFVTRKIDVKLNLCCNEFKFNLNSFICANRNDYVNKFAVIKSVIIKSFHCTKWTSLRENLSSGVCEQHRCRPACASAQSDQRLCYSFFEKFHM